MWWHFSSLQPLLSFLFCPWLVDSPSLSSWFFSPYLSFHSVWWLSISLTNTSTLPPQSSPRPQSTLNMTWTPYHGLWQSRVSISQPFLCVLPHHVTLCSLLSLFYFFLIPWTHKLAPSCHADIVLDVPSDWEALLPIPTWLTLQPFPFPVFHEHLI